MVSIFFAYASADPTYAASIFGASGCLTQGEFARKLAKIGKWRLRCITYLLGEWSLDDWLLIGLYHRPQIPTKRRIRLLKENRAHVSEILTANQLPHHNNEQRTHQPKVSFLEGNVICFHIYFCHCRISATPFLSLSIHHTFRSSLQSHTPPLAEKISVYCGNAKIFERAHTYQDQNSENGRHGTSSMI